MIRELSGTSPRTVLLDNIRIARNKENIQQTCIGFVDGCQAYQQNHRPHKPTEICISKELNVNLNMNDTPEAMDCNVFVATENIVRNEQLADVDVEIWGTTMSAAEALKHYVDFVNPHHCAMFDIKMGEKLNFLEHPVPHALTFSVCLRFNFVFPPIPKSL